MPSTYSPNLRLELIGTGEQAGTWGATTNTNVGTLLEQAISGITTVVMGNADYVLTANSGATDQARNMMLNLTSSASLTQTRLVTCPAVPKLYSVSNNTSGGQSITVTTALSGTTVTIPNGQTVMLFCDGTNVKPATTYSPSFAAAGVSMLGNLTFSGSARRITGDFSGASLANRVNFQTSTSNAPTAVAAIPNGSPGSSDPTNFTAFNSADPANAAYATLNITTSAANIGTGVTGTGTAVPVNIVSGGNLGAFFPTTGGMLVGTATAGGDVNNTKAAVAGAFVTQTGLVSAAHNTLTPLVYLPTALAYGVYLGCVSLDAADATNFSNVSLLIVQRTSSRLVSLATSGFLTSSLASPTNAFAAIQTSGTTQTIYWSVTRIQ